MKNSSHGNLKIKNTLVGTNKFVRQNLYMKLFKKQIPARDDQLRKVGLPQ